MKIKSFVMAFIAVLVTMVSCDKPTKNPSTVQPSAIKVTPAEPAMVSEQGGSLTLNLASREDWEAQDVPSWISVSPASGAGAYTPQVLTVTVAANTGEAREGVLKFVNENSSAEVKIKQNSGGSSVIFYEKFDQSMGDFTVKDVTVPQEIPVIWEFSSKYVCMKATAFANPNNYASESWLISPDIKLPSGKSHLTFEHAGGFFGTASNEATVWISKDNGTKWDQLVIDSKNYPSTWNFIFAGSWDLSKYAGNTVKIAFKYSSTATKAGTWEIREVKVATGEYNAATAPTVDPKKVGWMELPAMDNTAYGYYSHSFTMSSKAYRNYTFAWSQKDHAAAWVAYPLCKTYTNKAVQRTDAWAYDPLLGSELSAAPFSGYAGDYARGHQLPSADRLCCREANEQTFYGTNIVPQLNEHNEGIWAGLEDHVRWVANDSDTTYVVTGCILKGATEFSTDSDGKKVTIPTAFFKALLRYEANASGNVWTGAAFYTDHKQYSNHDFKAISMSIDELEQKTGYDFFVNLVDKIGADAAAAVEAQDPTKYSVWGL
jgi:DNA/RNA endonuclease G (NUC1)